MVAAELGQHLMAIYDKVVVDVLRRASRKLEDDGLHVEESCVALLSPSLLSSLPPASPPRRECRRPADRGADRAGPRQAAGGAAGVVGDEDD